jgi:glycosyltransferase involved in cell wall biosynthesis
MTATPIVHIVGDSDGGGTRFVAAILERLDRTRFNLTLVAPQADWLASACARAGAVYRPMPLMSSRVSATLRRDFRALLGATAPAIVHAHGTRAAWLAIRSLPRGVDAPALIYSEHLFSMDARRGPLTLPYRLIERAICRRAALITTTCAANAERIVRSGWATPERIALRHYGVDQAAIRAQVTQRLSRSELGAPADALVVGALGRLVPQKGFPYLLRAMRRVVARLPNARCVIVGDGPLRAALEEESRALGIEETVRFLGARSEPWATLVNCDVIALPSLFEGLPLALLEALTVGTPVVASRVGGAEELLIDGQNGLLTQPRDAATLADALTRALTDPALRAAFRVAGPASVSSYDIAPVAARIAEMYERAAKRSRGAADAATLRPSLAPRGDPQDDPPTEL